MFKNRTVQIGLGVVLLVLIVVGGFFFVSNKNQSSTKQPTADTEQVVQKLSPDDIGLTITPNDTNKSVKFVIAKPDGITSIEYQLTYDADSTAEEQSEGGEPRVQRGITGEAKITSGDTYTSPWLDLGSCSRNVCRYDTGVNSVDLTLKITKTDGKTYEVEKSLSL